MIISAEQYNRIIVKQVMEIEDLREHLEAFEQRENDTARIIAESKKRCEGHIQQVTDLNAELVIQKEAVRGLQKALDLMAKVNNEQDLAEFKRAAEVTD